MTNAFIKARGLCVDFPVAFKREETDERKAIGGPPAVGRFITKGRQRFLRAVNSVDLDVEPGERVGIWGKNGSGKTTMLRTLRGVYPPTEGTLEVQGTIQSFFNLSFGLNEDATGYENIILRGVLMGANPAEMHARMDEIAEFSELGEYLSMPMRNYSSGMRMRLAFSVASTLPADILLMDEWLSVGDIDFRRKAADRLKNVVQASKILVITSHNRQLLESVCTRLITISEGRILTDEPVTRTYEEIPFHEPN